MSQDEEKVMAEWDKVFSAGKHSIKSISLATGVDEGIVREIFGKNMQNMLLTANRYCRLRNIEVTPAALSLLIGLEHREMNEVLKKMEAFGAKFTDAEPRKAKPHFREPK